MHSNSLGKGKAKGKGIKMQSQMMKKLNLQYEGSIDNTYYVQAYVDFTKQWYKSKILACRLSKDFDVSERKCESSYDYYVHYQPLNRRNDQWIPYKYVRSTKQKIIEQEHKKKGNKKAQDKKDDKYSEHQGMDHQSLQTHLELTKFKTINRIQMGKYKCDAWYFSPYPMFYHNIDCLYVCEFCLNFYKLETEMKRHSENCLLFHPPGDQVYRDVKQKIAVFEIDGLKNPVYCQNLAFLSKLFLDHKNLEYDTSVFLFYMICQIVENEYHFAGYFSKPKQSLLNLSCIMILPFHQRKGYGKFLISLSYEFSLIQKKTGTPQKPLSDLGRETYLAWWSQRLVIYLRLHKNDIFTLEDIIKETAMTEQDILWTMDQTGLFKISNGQPCICTDQSFLDEIYKKGGREGKPVVMELIHWVPFKIKWEGQPIHF